MILFLEKCVLPNIKPDLSDLVRFYYYNIYSKDTYHNPVVDKYELSKHWDVPFIELVRSNNIIRVVIGDYKFIDLKKSPELINIYDGKYIITQTFYDFTKCPRQEGPIHFYYFGLEYYTLESVEATYNRLENYKFIERYRNGSTKKEEEYTNEHISFILNFTKGDFKFTILSDDIVHRLVKYDINEYKSRNTDYKKDIYLAYNPRNWYDYGEARTMFNLINTLRQIDELINNGVEIQDIDFSTFGTRYLNNKIIDRFIGIRKYEKFISSFVNSILFETDDSYRLSFTDEIITGFIPYYKFLLENIFELHINDDFTFNIPKEKFQDKELIIPFMIFNIMRNVESQKVYNNYIHTLRAESDDKYKKLVSFKEPLRCIPFEERIRDILKLEAKKYSWVLYRTGDRDDTWHKEQYLRINFNCQIDTATIYSIKQAIPNISYENSIFELKKKDFGHCDRFDTRYYEYDNSEKYRNEVIICLCKSMYNVYLSGIWEDIQNI